MATHFFGLCTNPTPHGERIVRVVRDAEGKSWICAECGAGALIVDARKEFDDAASATDPCTTEGPPAGAEPTGQDL